ncbi:hypothetical protein G6F70_007195 [Rhizopus microsporus]|nr:hypothetical protein G6F71_000618 [Rhizopus microsporus]KAG1196742.1 hypothetical protein G6F70_007195 [Rhizopus microsporus]KAG1208628.1 hypothetical protein G6F69_007053 [Rhizopus microsporus]KAG1229867.1 hypothetical protein G6F67_006854 [Rhizopus microsporus]KAG1262028.1 hypothetical protein G6F68_006235 [Rhizopus microsporus]
MKLLSAILFITSLSFQYIHADMAPSYPEPGTVWKAGHQYEIVWEDDHHGSMNAWKKFRIDFMTGDNDHQRFLMNVARNLDATKTTSFNWTAPTVSPAAPIYFFMFTNDKGENAWTTRFGITGEDGKLAKPQYTTQPDGSKIPWGVGKIVRTDNAASVPSPTYYMTPAQSSVLADNAAVVIAVSEATKRYSMPVGYILMMFVIILSSSGLFTN